MAKANDFMLKADRDLIAARFEKRRLTGEKTRRRGMVFYLLVWWILRWGAIMTGAVLVIDYLPNRNRLQGPQILFGFGVIAVTATLFGIWEWHSNERRYRGTRSMSKAL